MITASETGRGRVGLRRDRTVSRWAWVVASASFVLTLAAAGAPISLYTTYRSEDGFTDTDLAVVTFAYLSAVVITLLLGGRLSDYLGRKPVGLAALMIAVAGCVMFLWVHHPLQFLIARLLQGVACGLAPSCLGAYISETTPPRASWLAAFVTGSGPMMGISMGAIGGGALVQYAPHPRQLVFVVLVVVLLVCTMSLALCAETVTRRDGVLRSLRPQLAAPARARRALVTACLAAAATWPVGGFYQAFAPSVASQYLGAGNALVGALVFASVLVLNPLAGPMIGRRASTGWIHAAMVTLVLALAGLVVTLELGLAMWFIVAGLFIGLAQGMSSNAAMGLLLPATERTERAGVLATVYVASYASTAASVAAAAVLTVDFSLDTILFGYAVFGVMAAAVTSISAARQKRCSAT